MRLGMRMRSGGVFGGWVRKHLPISFSSRSHLLWGYPDGRTSEMTAFSSALTSAATRTAAPAAVQSGDQDHLVATEVIVSAHTGLRYRIGRLLGKGGFGQVYLATRLGSSRSVPEVVCIKVSPHIDGWLREAYFGQLLDGPSARHPRVRRLPARAARRPGALLPGAGVRAPRRPQRVPRARRRRAGPSATARREIAGILQVLGKLHRGQMLHRDLTPMNVFVCDGRRLKLGDFGIVRQQSDRRGITARTLNPLDGAERHPRGRGAEVAGARRRLPGGAAAGDAGEGRRAGARPHDARSARLPCSDHLKEIVYRCIGERRKRYESADELIEALRTPPARLQARRAADAARARTSRSPAS